MKVLGELAKPNNLSATFIAVVGAGSIAIPRNDTLSGAAGAIVREIVGEIYRMGLGLDADTAADAAETNNVLYS